MASSRCRGARSARRSTEQVPVRRSSRRSTASSHSSPSVKAASAAITPSSPAWSVSEGTRRIASRARSEAVTTSAALPAATLNAFDAEVSAMPRSRAASDTSSHGRGVAPSSTSAAQISSASTHAPCAWQMSAIRSSSWRRYTCPVGLCGFGSTEHADAGGERPLQGVDIQAAVSADRQLHQFAIWVGELGEERWVGWRREGHALARRRQDATQFDQADHHVRHERHLAWLDAPVQPLAGRTGRRRQPGGTGSAGA